MSDLDVEGSTIYVAKTCMYAGPMANKYSLNRTRYFCSWTRISKSVASKVSCQHINNLSNI